MGVLSQEERVAGEQRVREQLGLSMMCANTTGMVAEGTEELEREILGAQAYAFGEIWSRPGLDIQTRCYITIAVLTAKYQLHPLEDYIRAALRVGITPSDILEALLHLSSYTGLTAVAEAMNVARKVFAEEGLSKPAVGESTPVYPMDRQGRVDAQKRVASDIKTGRHADGSPLQYLKSGVWTAKAQDLATEQEFNLANGEYGYGECWGRPALGYRIRSFLTMAALQALFANDQLHFHINNAINIGLSGDEIHEALAHAGVYAGIANWRNAANVARDNFLQRGVVKPAAA